MTGDDAARSRRHITLPGLDAMTCPNCYHVNASAATHCYYCGARLTPTPGSGDPLGGSRGWGSSEPDPWTGGGGESAAYGGANDTAYGRTASDTAGAESRYTAPLHPDLVYNADGTIAVGAPPRFDGRPRRNAGPWRRLLAPLIPILILLSKLKFLLVFAKLGKIGLTGVTMLISVVTYAWAFGLGWTAALGFVLLLFVHEMGHWTVMRLKRVPATAPVFIPFLGAVIGMKGMPRSVKDEAEIGIAGPIAGTAGALVCLALANVYGGYLWPYLAFIGLLLNLFNLIPVSPLDGGRIAAAISRWLWPVGLVGLAGLFLFGLLEGRANPFLLFIAVLGGVETIARFRGRYAPTSKPGYYDIRPWQRIGMGALYFGLIALIVLAMRAVPIDLTSGI